MAVDNSIAAVDNSIAAAGRLGLGPQMGLMLWRTRSQERRRMLPN